MRRLYVQIYLTFVAILVLFSLLGSVAWWVVGRSEPAHEILRELGALAGEILPPADRPVSELQAMLEHWGARLNADLVVHGADGGVIAAAGGRLPVPDFNEVRPRFLRGRRGRGGALALPLPDGRWIVGRHPRESVRAHGLRGLLVIGALAGAIGIGAYPVVRRLTRRLERLQARVDALGEGDLSARVDVEGKDEVAVLARSFNRAAARVEALVNAQRNTLASASHELRSPLARIRVAVELLQGDDRPELRERIERDIAELDDLIGELLLASRLDAQRGPAVREEIDLLGLVAEEGARAGAVIEGEPAHVAGDPRMLRRLVRNLLENARRYGAGTLIEAAVSPGAAGEVVLRVMDRGPGVAESEREKIFEPFYRPAGFAETADGGVGLGLALVRQIANHHGGRARCLAREGGGTCFEVTLACAE